MERTFNSHTITSNQDLGGSRRDDARTAAMVDTATEYFAYIGMMSAAVVVAVAALVFSGQTALKWVDAIARPAETTMQLKPTVAPSPVPATEKTVRGTFAMLPSSMPLRLRDDIIATNF
jgi:hypothetical protein